MKLIHSHHQSKFQSTEYLFHTVIEPYDVTFLGSQKCDWLIRSQPRFTALINAALQGPLSMPSLTQMGLQGLRHSSKVSVAEIETSSRHFDQALLYRSLSQVFFTFITKNRLLQLVIRWLMQRLGCRNVSQNHSQRFSGHHQRSKNE